jgi:hypothetical protein
MGDSKPPPSRQVARSRLAPFPIPDFRQVFAVFINVLLVLDQFVLEPLFQAWVVVLPSEPFADGL